MNILFLANRFPYPPFRGDKLKIYNLAKQLSRRHNLFLLTFIQDKKDYKHLPELEKFFAEINLVFLPGIRSMMNCITHPLSSDPFQINYFRSGEMKKQLAAFLMKHRIDVIHTQHLRMAQYTSGLRSVKTVIDLPDAYSLYWKRRLEIKRNVLRHAFEKSEYGKIRKYEKIIREFDLTLVCSDEDREYLINEHSAENIKILPNGVDTGTFFSSRHDYDNDRVILLAGNMGYYPNVDAAVYFANEIFPSVKRIFPGVTLRIAGQNPARKVQELAGESIGVTGFVKSLEEEYKKCSLAISPVRVGAGTMNKVLEPMAMGVPVVMSAVGFRGLNAVEGRDVLVARDTESFIRNISLLLESAERRRSLGEAGKKVVQENFSWETIAGKLELYLAELTGGDHEKLNQ